MCIKIEAEARLVACGLCCGYVVAVEHVAASGGASVGASLCSVVFLFLMCRVQGTDRRYFVDFFFIFWPFLFRSEGPKSCVFQGSDQVQRLESGTREGRRGRSATGQRQTSRTDANASPSMGMRMLVQQCPPNKDARKFYRLFYGSFIDPLYFSGCKSIFMFMDFFIHCLYFPDP